MKEDIGYRKPVITAMTSADLNWLWTRYQCKLIEAMNFESFSKKARQEAFDMFLIENGREDLIGRLHCI